MERRKGVCREEVVHVTRRRTERTRSKDRRISRCCSRSAPTLCFHLHSSSRGTPTSTTNAKTLPSSFPNTARFPRAAVLLSIRWPPEQEASRLLGKRRRSWLRRKPMPAAAARELLRPEDRCRTTLIQTLPHVRIRPNHSRTEEEKGEAPPRCMIACSTAHSRPTLMPGRDPKVQRSGRRRKRMRRGRTSSDEEERAGAARQKMWKVRERGPSSPSSASLLYRLSSGGVYAFRE
mmetsp:Transcript_2257/g.5278  ORF Transcript_2257/g.5278 Transcript_2257/m.5278 type:complete len:234 (-) Transcript_2257:730-1431(-)